MCASKITQVSCVKMLRAYASRIRVRTARAHRMQQSWISRKPYVYVPTGTRVIFVKILLIRARITESAENMVCAYRQPIRIYLLGEWYHLVFVWMDTREIDAQIRLIGAPIRLLEIAVD